MGALLCSRYAETASGGRFVIGGLNVCWQAQRGSEYPEMRNMALVASWSRSACRRAASRSQDSASLMVAPDCNGCCSVRNSLRSKTFGTETTSTCFRSGARLDTARLRRPLPSIPDFVDWGYDPECTDEPQWEVVRGSVGGVGALIWDKRSPGLSGK